jgi:Protein of unknown function (DUF2490)
MGYAAASSTSIPEKTKVMFGRGNTWPAVIAVVLFSPVPVSAQTTQLLPEIDTYLKLNPDVRVSFQAKETREGGEPTQAELGPSIYFYLKPFSKLLQDITASDLDDSKKRFVILSGGYRYLPSPNSPPENRLELVAEFHIPAKARFLISDRNREDLDWSNGNFSWRYRNRPTVERTVWIHSYRLIPYTSAEFFYESQYKKWSTTSLYAGCLFPIKKHVQFDFYYEHENNTGKRPNQQINSVGLVLNLFFAPGKS